MEIPVMLYFESDNGGDIKSLSDAQGAVLAVHNPAKTDNFNLF